MHILIRCAGSIKNTLLLPLKYRLAGNESRAIIGMLSDLDCKSHCCSLRPYCCSLEGHKAQTIIILCFTGLLFFSWRVLWITMYYVAPFVLPSIFWFANISKSLHEIISLNLLWIQLFLILIWRGMRQKYIIFYWVLWKCLTAGVQMWSAHTSSQSLFCIRKPSYNPTLCLLE